MNEQIEKVKARIEELDKLLKTMKYKGNRYHNTMILKFREIGYLRRLESQHAHTSQEDDNKNID